MCYIFNNELIKSELLNIDSRDRAFQYGDGIFETIIYKNNKVYYLEDHIKRLTKGMQKLHLNTPGDFSVHYFEELFRNLINIKKLTSARLKIIVWRKAGGLFSPLVNDINFLVSIDPYQPAVKTKEHVIFSEEIKNERSSFSAFKTLSSLKYVIAGIEKTKKKVDDIIIEDFRGNISECLSSNIFLIADSKVWTPTINTGCVEGVMRAQIKEFCITKGIAYIESDFTREKITSESFLFTSNVSGLSSIKKIGSIQMQNKNEIFNEIFNYFNN